MTMMNQWHTCKQEACDAVVLFRLGDFYEAFHEDALLVSKETGVTLTKRQEVPMSGVPAHTSDIYIEKLIKRGYKVAIVEQVEDAKQAKGLVKREIVRIVTPGTVMHGSLLSSKEPAFIACLIAHASCYALAFLDVTTGELITTECTSSDDVTATLSKFAPKELLISSELSCDRAWIEHLCISTKEASFFDKKQAIDFVNRHFSQQNICDHTEGVLIATGSLLRYINLYLKLSIEHITSLHRHNLPGFMMLGKTTQKHLELVEPMHEKSHTLLHVLDKTKTPMGGRRLRHFILHPLLCTKMISERQEVIAAFLQEEHTMRECAELLTPICDIERLIVRAESGSISPRDLAALANSLKPVSLIKKHIQHFPADFILLSLVDVKEVVEQICTALVDSPPAKLHEAPVFRKGYNQTLDDLYNTLHDNQGWLAAYQERLRVELDIKTLKVSYTHAIGHYI